MDDCRLPKTVFYSELSTGKRHLSTCATKTSWSATSKPATSRWKVGRTLRRWDRSGAIMSKKLQHLAKKLGLNTWTISVTCGRLDQSPPTNTHITTKDSSTAHNATEHLKPSSALQVTYVLTKEIPFRLIAGSPSSDPTRRTIYIWMS